MEKSEESRRYKWSNAASNLLVSVWSHDLVQNQLKLSTRNQPIWESIARYMTRKGFRVTGLQCKNRIKNMLSCYQDCVRKNDFSGLEPHDDIFKKVLSRKNIKKDLKATSEPVYSEETSEEVSNNFDSNAFKPKTSIPQNATDNEYEMEFLDVTTNCYHNTLNSPEIIKQLETIMVKAIDLQTKAITNAIKIQKENDQNDSIAFRTESSISQNTTENDYETEFLDNTTNDYHNNVNSSEVISQLESIVVRAIDLQTKAITNAIKMQTEMIEKLLNAERDKLEVMVDCERESRKQLELRLDKLLTKLETNTVQQITYMGTLIETKPE